MGVWRSAFGGASPRGEAISQRRGCKKRLLGPTIRIRGRWSFFDGLGRVFDASGDFLDCLLVELVSGIEGPCVGHRSAFGVWRREMLIVKYQLNEAAARSP